MWPFVPGFFHLARYFQMIDFWGSDSWLYNDSLRSCWVLHQPNFHGLSASGPGLLCDPTANPCPAPRSLVLSREQPGVFWTSVLSGFLSLHLHTLFPADSSHSGSLGTSGPDIWLCPGHLCRVPALASPRYHNKSLSLLLFSLHRPMCGS